MGSRYRRRSWRARGLLALAGFVTLAACGDGITGNAFGGEECVFDRIEFHDDMTVVMTRFGVTTVLPGTYEVAGDQVVFSATGGGSEFVMNLLGDGSLELRLAGTPAGRCVRID